MKKLVLILLLLVANFHGYSQQYSLKEQYDYINYNLPITSSTNTVYNGIFNYIEAGTPFSGYVYGENIGSAMESYLRMYETTKDKAYLIKFINLSIKVLSWRNADFKFTTNDEEIYMNGFILWAMAHFSHLVFYDETSLKTLPLPSSLLINSPQSFPTYEYFADWLISRQVESLDAIINDHWISDDKGFKQLVGDEEAMQVNQQATLSSALLYLGHLSTNVTAYSGLASYLDKAAKIALLYKSDINLSDDCVGNNSCTPDTYNQPLLRILPNNSYYWYHNGWQIVERTCFCSPINKKPSIAQYLLNYEDISHGSITTIFPRLAFKFSLYTNGGYPFSTAEMVRFRNSFSKNIWDASLNNNSGGFHNAVNGSDFPIFPCPSSNTPDPDCLAEASLLWMPFYKFDGADATATGDNVYDIIKNFYVNHYYNSPGYISEGGYYFGLSEIVAAQWDKECTDLKLYNRDVVYNQDFTSKKKLIISPKEYDAMYHSGDRPFAEPILPNSTYTDGAIFKIESGTVVNMIAGESINIGPGFDSGGGTLDARIEPSACTNGNRMSGSAQQNNTQPRLNADSIAQLYTNRHSEKIKTINSSSNSFNIAPNPNNGSFTLTSNNTTSSISITNILGEVVFRTQTTGATTEINLNNQSKGIYFVTVKGEVGSETKKVVVE